MFESLKMLILVCFLTKSIFEADTQYNFVYLKYLSIRTVKVIECTFRGVTIPSSFLPPFSIGINS